MGSRTGQQLLYTELADWWPVMSDPSHYDEEAELFRDAIERTSTIPVAEVLELGCGGGNNASHLKEHWRLTLVDLSEGVQRAKHCCRLQLRLRQTGQAAVDWR